LSKDNLFHKSEHKEDTLILLRKKDTKRKEKKEGYLHKNLLVRQFTQAAVFNFCLNGDFLFQQSAQKI